ncbi:MAG: hypothetical protein ACJAY5_001957 [Actinomycetes bacterium]|jgi:hypothetical protein
MFTDRALNLQVRNPLSRIVLERMNAKNATHSLEDLKDLLEADST